MFLHGRCRTEGAGPGQNTDTEITGRRRVTTDRGNNNTANEQSLVALFVHVCVSM